MTGVDAAAELIRAARQRGPESIRYHVGDARELGFVPEAAFDAAACVLAIQNIHPIQPVFEGVRRALRPGGRFVLVMMHPAFRGPKETRWGWDEAEEVQFRRVDRYLLPRKSPIVTQPRQHPRRLHVDVPPTDRVVRQGDAQRGAAGRRAGGVAEPQDQRAGASRFCGKHGA